jgi:kynurenine formamidase
MADMRMSASNWGLWGPDDERGALNRLTPAATLRGISCVTTGETISLAVPLKAGQGPIAAGRQPMQHFMSRDGGDYAAGLKERGFGFADDYIVMATHGTTHIDALSHVFRDRQMWNGFAADSVTSRGARRCGIEKVGPIITRAIFADFGPPDGTSRTDDYAIGPAELAAEVERSGVVPQSGDALVVRTGWLARWREGRATEGQWAGLHPSCAQWIDEQGFVLVAADNIAVEQGPSTNPMEQAPLHVELIRNRGIYLAELLDLELLAATQRRSFLLMIAPLPIHGGVGSPINPVAVL